MIPPGTPYNETERLAAVHATGLLETPYEERFDRITRIAHRLFNVPIALVTMVDTRRQWFKSCIGLDVRETSREASFCGHAILDDDIFLIEDAHKDERFIDNPLVTGNPYIRFYAGCPIRIGRGLRMGTLCIIDSVPRKFPDEDRALLRDLGSIVESELTSLNLAVTDELTQLLNLRGFKLMVKNNIALSKRSEFKATLAFLDLDGFKGINDQFGHTAGDKALCDFASLLTGSVRSSDLVARLGGDEFAIMFNNSDEQESQIAMANLDELVEAYNIEQGDNINLCFSYGLENISADADMDIELLLDNADRKMYLRKKSKQI